MPDASYDAVIIGAGHNGLCLSAYLARAGWKVAAFERRHDEGGGAHTDEATVPGFWHNLHAQYMEFIEMMPIYRDFDLPSFGARMIKPDAQVGIAFADGRPPLVIYRPELAEKTRKSIAYYSPRDAERFHDIRTKVLAATDHISAMLYSPPANEIPLDARTEETAGRMLQLWVDIGFGPQHMNKSPKVLIDEVFESPELRATLYRQCVEWGANLHAGDGFGFVMCVIWLCANHYLSVGGTHTLAHSMASAALNAGADLRYNSPVVEILTSGGRATGVRLKDGRTIEARKLVASNADPRTTFIDLIGMDKLSDFRKERMSNWRFGPEHVLGTPSFALRNAPDYKSARHNPDINKCFYTIVGYENDQQVSDYILQAYGGQIPDRPGAGTWVNSLWDPSQAPPGLQVMNGWFFFPRASCLTEEEWARVRNEYNGKFLKLWGDYAPNMTRDNVIADKLYVSFDMEKRIAMPEGDFSHGRLGHLNPAVPRHRIYRTEIEGLYMCGASAGGGGISSAGGYNAYKVIAHDFNLPKMWRSEGRLY
ncbi:MAG TPA: NAD(P)/FAD-dependent oxidoreductase [Candidatus Binataceae bacterium]|nr:NAD(P)/FAD-dependent oxidoreductase [Candidatus Binataceae bacterium]